MLISVVNRCTVKNVGAIPWKSDWQIYYCGEVNKFWLGVDEIEEAAIYEKSHSATMFFDMIMVKNQSKFDCSLMLAKKY